MSAVLEIPNQMPNPIRRMNVPKNIGYRCQYRPQLEMQSEPKDSTKKRPLWFFFPGFGSHTVGAGHDLMRIPVFAATIEKAAAVLRPFDLDLIWILTEAPEAVLEDVTNSMVSIVAMQVALVDVLRAIGLDADGMFATSIGEFGAAYVDNTLSLEQTMLAAYWLGRSITEAKVPTGPKAVLNMAVDQFAKRCPPDIEIIVKAADGVGVAGPDASIKNLIDVLSSEGINAKIFGTRFFQYHTSYVEAAALAYRKHLEPIITNPKPHSSKWISTSLPPDKWDSETGKLINAEFFSNNIRAPVDMITPIHAMPKNAVLVEISARAVALSHMTYLPATVIPIELIRKEAPDPALQLFKGIGKIYEATGQQPPVEQLSAVFSDFSTDLQGKHWDNMTKREQ